MQKLILGTVQLGIDYGINNPSGKPSLEESLNILSFAQNNGVETLDTAEGYGNALEVIGNYHKAHPHFKVINKFGTAENIEEQVNTSLKKLSIPSFEAYLFHSFRNFTTHEKTILPLLINLKQSGKINKIGISIYTNEEMEIAINTNHIDLIQLPFNLLDNLNKRGVLLEKAKQKGKEIHVRSVFLQGLFFMDEKNIPSKLKPLSTYLWAVHEIAGRFNIPVQSLALNYALNCPLIDKVLIGVDSLTQLKENIKFAKDTPEPAIFEAINNINVKEFELLNPVNWK